MIVTLPMWRWLLVMAPLCLVVSGNTNYNIYNYDQTNSQFTPDGRLLQIEYASVASEQSPPVMIVDLCGGNDNDDDERCLVLMTIPKQEQSIQQRFIILEHHQGERKNNMPIVLAMSGILSDSLALIQAGLKQLQEPPYSSNSPRVITAMGMAQQLADECQMRSFGGGIRPYGSAVIVCGFDHVDDNRNPCVFQTDPSGGMIQHYFRRRDQEDGSSTDSVIVLGGGTLATTQRKRLIQQAQREISAFRSRDEPTATKQTLSDKIAALARILIQTTTTNQQETTTTSKQHAKEEKSKKNDYSCSPLEIVVLSPRWGCHRLDKEQIEAIQKRI